MKYFLIVLVLSISGIPLFSQDTNSGESQSAAEPSIQENAKENETRSEESVLNPSAVKNSSQAAVTNKDEQVKQPLIVNKKPEDQNIKSDEMRLLTAIDANPKKADSYNRLIMYYYSQGKHKERLKIALRAIQNMGRTAYWCEIVGDENKFLGDFQNALISYQFAIMLIPTDADIYNRIGLILLKMSNFNQAETAFKASIFLSSNEAYADKSVYYNNLALAVEAMHDLQSAYKYIQIAVKYNPGYAAAQDNALRIKNVMISSGVPVN